MTRSLWLAAALLASFASAQVLINEIHAQGPSASPALQGDYVELRNTTGNPIDLGGWQLKIWANDTGTVTTKTIPLQAACGSGLASSVIPGHCFYVLQEGGTLGGSLTDPVLAGVQGMRMGSSPWAATASIGAALVNAQGACVDYVYLRRSVLPPPATPPNLSGCAFTLVNIATSAGTNGHFKRLVNADTNTVADWSQDATTNVGTPGAPNTTLGATQTSTGACTAPSSASLYQLNQANAAFDIDGVSAGACALTELSRCVGAVVNVTIGGLAGAPFDVVLTAGNVVSATGGGLVLSSGQIFNLNIADPTLTYAFGGFTSPLFPVTLPYTLAFPLDLSLQLAAITPGAPDGISLSQATRLHATATTPSIAGPAGDDVSLTVNLANVSCAPPSINFWGTSFSNMHVTTNGRVTMGGADTAYTATLAAAMAGVGFVGHWVDYGTTVAGSVTYAVTAPGVISVNYNGIGYIGQTAATVSTFSIAFDTNTNTVAINNLSGIAPHPLTTTLGYLGITKGAGATDPGATTFAVAGSGTYPNGTDMSYAFGQAGAQLAGTGVNQIIWVPNLSLGYDWVAY